MHQKLIHAIQTVTSVNGTDVALINRYFEPVSYRKHETLEEEGKIPRYLYYIVSGYLRLFHYNDQGEEVTTHINCPPGFLTSYFNFINDTPSHEFVESVTITEALRISKANLDTLTSVSTAMKDFSISVFQQAVMYNETRSKELSTLSAEQRYYKLMENYPDILHNVPLQYIASFLGMNPKSLSRIRRQIN